MEAHAPTTERAYVGLGANLGDAQVAFNAVLEQLARDPDDVRVVQRSSLYRSAPVDAAGPDYLNAVIAVDSKLAPLALLEILQTIERGAGRLRPYRNAPRTLDLDLLLFGHCGLDESRLTLPHPRMHQRAFVLRPLAEIAPDLQIPGQGPLMMLLDTVRDQAIERVGEWVR